MGIPILKGKSLAMRHLAQILSFFWLAGFMGQLSAQPVINSINPSANSVELNGKLEIALDIQAVYTNPYNYNQIEVWGIFTAPDSQTIQADGFFLEKFDLNSTGNLSPDGEAFHIRFAPTQTGTWTYQVFVRDQNGMTGSATDTFSCGPRISANNHGYARTNPSNYLSLDDGDPCILIGENMCWQNNQPYLDYKNWLDKLTTQGGNYIRLWHAHWGLGIEWKDNWNGFEGLRQYHQANSRYQDWLFDYCADQGVYIMLALQHHGPVSTQVNPNWNDSPYNAANGGPCQNTWDFFSDSTAIAHTKNRYRYIVARWGYARSIMAWELFNEVEWTDNYQTHQSDIMLWHAEMAAYLKSIDPYGHIVTTSFAKEENDPVVWAIPEIDITQTHHYINTPNLERALATSIRSYLEDFQKPTMNGEFGLGPSSTLPALDPDGIHIHNSLWAGLFSGGLGTGMTWWWDIYIEKQNLYYHFKGISEITPDIPFAEKDMKPAPVVISGAPGSLIITPTQNWGVIGLDSVFINQDGILTPENPGGQLSTYLYGSQWNTQFRSPPVFRVYFPSSGTFTVRTGGSAGQSPNISIWLNGAQVLNQAGQTGSSYSINVNAGWNTIRVDNTGTDWINISRYEFSGLGSQLDAYVLRSGDQKVATGYILHTGYNHEEAGNQGPPVPVTGASLQLTGFADSSYFVKWYNCLTGDITSVDQVMVSNGVLDLPIPPVGWDQAFIVDDQDAFVADIRDIPELSFEVYPNPAEAGTSVYLNFDEKGKGNTEITLIDMNGRQILLQQAGSEAKIALDLPPLLTQGYYWVVVKRGEISGTKALLIH